MRIRPLALAAAALLALAACGDDDDPAPAAPQAPPVTGTVLGQPFAAVEATALVLSRATCDFSGFPASATGLLLGFSTSPGLCAVVTQTQGCGAKASATIVTVLLVRAHVLGGSAAPVQPGTYAISASFPSPDAQGQVTVAQAVATRTDPACATPAGTPSAASGTVRIDGVGARVSGSIDLVFEDGSRVVGSFSAPACGFQSDVCTALDGGSCGARACVP